MSVYRHLTLAEREYIMVQRARGRSITAIAAALMRNKSTISREIKRNSDSKTYSASQAQACYQQRRKACRRKRKLDDPERFALVKRLFLQKHWSPEQIQHRLRHEGSPHAISYATIYRGIYAGRFNDPDWVKSGKQRLRHRGKKRLRKGAAARGGGGGAGGKNILSAAVSAVATRDEREHQRPATGILPETSGHCAVF